MSLYRKDYLGMDFDYKNIQKTIGYDFNNLDLLAQAFTRKSYSQENGGQNNEVLEFVGDKVLDLVVTKMLIDHYGVMTEDKKWNELKLKNPAYFQTKSKEGIFTDIKKELVQKKTLARAIDDLGFAKFLYLGNGENRKNLSDSVKEDLFEAILGAAAIDCDWNLDKLIYTTECMIDIHGFLNSDFEDDNYVGKVQEWYVKEYGSLPEYEIEPSYYYQSSFKCYLRIGYNTFSGEGSSKAKARMQCAEEAYWFLKENGYIKDSLQDYIDDYDESSALMIINELFQKKLISQPTYTFSEKRDGDEVRWTCSLSIKDQKKKTRGFGYTKKDSQRDAAVKMLDYLSK